MRVAAPWVALLLVAGTVSGCDPVGELGLNLCFDSPCSSGGGTGGGTEYAILGFPPDRINIDSIGPSGGYIFPLGIGDSVRIYLSRGAPSAGNADTVRNVTWGILGSGATISREGTGAALLRGAAPGTAHVLANGNAYTAWACDAVRGSCSRVGEIRVR